MTSHHVDPVLGVQTWTTVLACDRCGDVGVHIERAEVGEKPNGLPPHMAPCSCGGLLRADSDTEEEERR